MIKTRHTAAREKTATCYPEGESHGRGEFCGVCPVLVCLITNLDQSSQIGSLYFLSPATGMRKLIAYDLELDLKTATQPFSESHTTDTVIASSIQEYVRSIYTLHMIKVHRFSYTNFTLHMHL